MNPDGGQHMLEILVRNLSWMSGNTFLAWAAMLFVWHLRGSDRAQRVAGAVLMGVVQLMLFARLSVRGAMVDATARSIVIVVVVGVAAAAWSIRARAGDRWAHVVGYVGVLAFAPNAPYVMTDLFHHVQDIRLLGTNPSGGSILGNVLTSIEYGWFLVLGSAAWIALVDAGRDWLHRHRPGVPGWRVLLPVCAVMAFGIYLGRIERFHSWHPLGEPVRFVREVGAALTNPGPIAFILVWWVATFAAAVVGLRLLDHARAGGVSVWTLLMRASWVFTGVLLASAPLVPRGYAMVDVAVPGQSRAVAIVSVALGIALVASQLVRARRTRALVPRSRRVAIVGAVALIAVPVVAGAVTTAAFAQWYAQFRGLCEYGPSVDLHGEGCG
ncbi:MAG: hypothetical protein JWL76_428 [Thermoleophilia bacterium]|nr:hypothetical protein [Thermoleophilia bacterium]